MTRQQALTQARTEISRVYRTGAVSWPITTWGFSILVPGRGTVQSDIGLYHQAIAARREALAERVASLLSPEEC